MKHINKVTITSFLLFLLSIVFFIYRNIIGFGYLPFSDESGHFLGAIAIHHGDILYRDYIDAHGPVIFMLTWLLGQILGFTKVWLFRLVSTIFIILAGITVFRCSIFKELWQRFLATFFWFFSISSFWIVQAVYTDSYWTVGGALTVIILATTIFPMLYESNIIKTQYFISGFAIGLLPLIAYPFSVLSALFILVILYISLIKRCLYSNHLLMVFLGCLSSIGIVFLWLLIYGDIGGMIAFHFIANQFYYSNYISANFTTCIQSLIPRLDLDWLIQDLAIFSFFSACIILCFSSKYKVGALLVICGIISLELRGSITFQNGAFLIASFGFLSLSLIEKTKKFPRTAIVSTISILVVVVMFSDYATTSPFHQTRLERKNVHWQLFKERPDVGFVQEIQKYTETDQRILVIPYNPDIYIYANRLSIKKYHEYLPWEADYAKSPWYGYDRDICIDLPKEKPSAIYFDNYVVWGRYSAQSYMSCVIDFMNKEYTRMPNDSFVYIRNDLLNKK